MSWVRTNLLNEPTDENRNGNRKNSKEPQQISLKMKSLTTRRYTRVPRRSHRKPNIINKNGTNLTRA